MLPPAILMIAGGIAVALLPRRLRPAVAVVVPMATLWMVCTIADGATVEVPFMGYSLVLLKVDRLSRLFGAIFAIIAAAGGIYAYHMKETGQQSAALIYGGGAIGVAFAGDFFTLLFFTELMALSSVYLVWARRTPEAERAGLRYILMHLGGGSLMMAGILLHLSETGSIHLQHFASTGSLAPWLVLAGVALNGAIPPLHPWLPDAYPKATVTGAIFLCAFTTKSSVYVLIRLFAGWEILIYFGIMTALYGAIYALLVNDIREILAYSIISQVGYMVTAVGIGTTMAINGAAAHAFSHILYKALLFMGAGVVLHTTGRSRLTELGGLVGRQRLTFILYMVGALSISGLPLLNGFISKSMVVSAAGQARLGGAVLFLLLASIGSWLHTGLRLPYFTWLGKDRGLEPVEPPRNMLVGMGILALLCILFGIAPSLLYRHLPYEVHFHPYTVPHLVETTQILILAFVGFWLLRARLVGEHKIVLDTDWFYRRPAPFLKEYVVELTYRAFTKSETLAVGFVHTLTRTLRNPIPMIQRLATVPGTAVSEGEFDPDRARPVVQFVVGLVLLTFVVTALLILL